MKHLQRYMKAAADYAIAAEEWRNNNLRRSAKDRRSGVLGGQSLPAGV